MDKKMVYIGLFIGSLVGGYIPTLWGAGPFSMASIFGGAIGSLAGIWLAYRFMNF
jgi:uncharacterized membrane protein YeaQ/YmgE (transglycosylase-associated protein family)